MKRLRLEHSMEWKEKQLAIEAALLYGFQTETAEFPIAALDGEIEVPGTEDELTALWRLEAKAAPEGYLPAKKERFLILISERRKVLRLCLEPGSS